MTDRPLVIVIDDDESVRESLPDLLKILGYPVLAFASGAAFLQSNAVDQTGCLILDVAMPEMTGPQLRRELMRRGHDIPVIFITAHRDEFDGVTETRGAAAECLYKPFSEADLVSALERALEPG